MKFKLIDNAETLEESPSARKVWIEIILIAFPDTSFLSRLLRGRCGLKYLVSSSISLYSVSPSARKVWIEIYLKVLVCYLYLVAFCEEGVD